MKKNLLFLGLASVMLAFTGCTKDDAENGLNTPSEPGVTAPQTIVAQLGDNATRTVLAPDGKTATWFMGDRIGIYTAETKTRRINYLLNEACSGKSEGVFTKATAAAETFTAVPIGRTAEGAVVKRYVAIYPLSQLMYYQPAPTAPVTIGANVPNKQTYVKNGYDPKALTMISVFEMGTSGEPISLKFKYLNSLLCMPVTGDANITFDKIVIAGTSSDGRFAAGVTGPVNFTFQEDYGDGTTLEGRLANFADMSKSIINWEGVTSKDPLILKGSALEPLTFGAEETKIYFGVSPDLYNDGPSKSKMHIAFYLKDGSKFEKNINVRSLTPGGVCTLPTSNIALPYIPTMEYNTTTKIASWTKDAKATEYTVVALLDDEVMASYTPVENSADIEKEIIQQLNRLPNYTLEPGIEYSMQLVLKSSLVDKKTASASYSIPVDFTFSKQLVKANPIVKIMSGAGTKELKLFISNYQLLEDGGATLTVKHVAIENATYPGDFLAAKAVSAEGVPFFPYDNWAYNWAPGTHYSLVAIATYKDGTVLVSDVVKSYAELGPVPTAVDAELRANNYDEISLYINNYKAIMDGCPDAKIVVYGKIGEDQNMDDVTGLDKQDYYDSEDGMGILWFPEGRDTNPCTYKIVVTSAKYLKTPLTCVVSEHPAPAPTEVLLEANPRSVSVTNAEKIMNYTNNTAVFTVYAKAGANADMTDVTGCESKVLEYNPWMGCSFKPSSFPADGATAVYTYKVVATGENLPAEGIFGIFSE
ncbi:MAG: hypothetical protein RRZ83_02250 [Alistipes sp.]